MKYLILPFLLLLVLGTGQRTMAQTSSLSPWQIGFGIGYTNYSGDLSNYRIRGLKDFSKLYHFADFNKYYIDKPSFSVMIHKRITPTLGFMIQANTVSFSMSDRYRNRHGSFDTTGVHYARSLNFRTSVQDLGLAFTFRTNNGKFLPENAFFSPSFFLGAGVSRFKVMGDLYNANGQPYNYRLPGNINDGNFETNLRDIMTETDEKYPNVIPYVDLGLGLNFRFSNTITLSIQSDIKYSASDYLDDVSGVYKTSYTTPAQQYAARPGYNVVNPLNLQRGDDNGTNDFYINNRVMLSIGLGKRKKEQSFTAPAVYALSMPYSRQREREADSIGKRQATLRDSLLTAKNDSLAVLAKKNDSLARTIDSARIRKTGVREDSLRNGLDSIRAELREIKSILQEQQVRPRYAQLQGQADSLKALQAKISSQHTVSREDNLRLRIYQLQADSVRGEMQKLQQSHNELLPANYQPAQNKNRTTPVQPLSASAGTQPVVADTVRRAVVPRTDTVNTSAAIKDYNTQLKALKKDKRYKADTTYRRNVDSMSRKLADYEKQVKAANANAAKANKANSRKNVQSAVVPPPVVRRDTVISREDQRKVDSLQHRMHELEQKLNIRSNPDTAAVNRLRQQTTQQIAYNRAVDSENLNRSIAQMESRINVSNDSVLYWKRQLQRANDSAAYYNKLANSMSQDDNTKKAKWYQEIFTTQRSKERAVNEAAERDRLAAQENSYQQQAARTNRVIDDLERRNRDLSDQYRDLVSDRDRRRNNNDLYLQAPPSGILYDNKGNVVNGNNRDYNELRSLRTEISRLRGEVNNANERSNQFYYPPAGTVVTVPADDIQRPAPATTVVQDTATIALLRSGLQQLRGQLDSMKSSRPAAAPREAAPAEKFDVKSFPIVSVYFASGSTVLSSDQIRKLTPFAQVAARNPEATVLLKGFTDPTGNASINDAIARKRSDYVKNLLTTRFRIAEERISADEPAVSEGGRTRKANPLDRRVDLEFN